MADTDKDKDLDETKRIMERLVKTPPDHKIQKKTAAEKQAKTPTTREKPKRA